MIEGAHSRGEKEFAQGKYVFTLPTIVVQFIEKAFILGVAISVIAVSYAYLTKSEYRNDGFYAICTIMFLFMCVVYFARRTWGKHAYRVEVDTKDSRIVFDMFLSNIRKSFDLKDLKRTVIQGDMVNLFFLFDNEERVFFHLGFSHDQRLFELMESISVVKKLK